MKLKLAALLFSQAATQAVQIDKSNYKEHLCDSDLFKTVSVVKDGDSKWVTDSAINHIIGNYINYCEARTQHEQAVSSPLNKGLVNSSVYVEKTGIHYAEVCEKLKNSKKDTPELWNEAVPSFHNCTSLKRK